MLVFFALSLFCWITAQVDGKSPFTCDDVTIQDPSQLDRLFNECGAVVFHGRVEDPLIQNNPASLISRLLKSEVVLVDKPILGSTDHNLGFTSLIQQPFGNNAAFPPFAAIIMIATDSIDMGLCVGERLDRLPCPPESYRRIELEAEDAVIIDPARARFRVCDAHYQITGCITPSPSTYQVMRFVSHNFAQIPKLIFDNATSIVIGDGGFDRVYKIVKELSS